MHWPRLLNKYIFLEISLSFLFSFAVFLISGLIAGFLPLLQKGMEAGLKFTMILFSVLINALPSTLVTVLPLSLVIAILMALGRMSADNEIAAIKSAGISIVRLLPPVVFIGLLGTGLSLCCTLWLIPKGITEGKRLIREAATNRIDVGLEERTFFDKINNLVIYVEHIDSSTGILSNIFIYEKSQPTEAKTILSKKGKISPDPESNNVILELKNGSILKQNPAGETTGGLAFESYSFRFPLQLPQTLETSKTLEEMSLAEILKRIGEAREKEAQAESKEFRDYYKKVIVMGKILLIQRFTHPLACLSLAIIAFPIGILNIGKSKLNNVTVGLSVIFSYYAISLACERFARSALSAPELVLPLPPVLFLLLGLMITNRVRLETFDTIITSIKNVFRMPFGLVRKTLHSFFCTGT
jgi:lipopolysaccharide export system permease protein